MKTPTNFIPIIGPLYADDLHHQLIAMQEDGQYTMNIFLRFMETMYLKIKNTKLKLVYV
jgi:hypothetical protein